MKDLISYIDNELKRLEKSEKEYGQLEPYEIGEVKQLNEILKRVKSLTIPDVVGQSEQLKCDCCNGTGLVEGEHYDDIQGCLTCNGRGTF